MSELAYLVIREGGKWSDVFRLIPGQAATIGRAPTNQIVLKDDRCSRNHVEVFFTGGQWVLRDLDSRNGTMIGTQRIVGDHLLKAGDIIRIGRSQLIFVHTLAEAFSDSSAIVRSGGLGRDGKGPPVDDDDASVLEDYGPTTITHRRGQTRFLEPEQAEEAGVSKIGRAAAKLCRLAFELAKVAGHRQRGGVGPGRPGARHPDRRRRRDAAAQRLPGTVEGRCLGDDRLAQFLVASLPSLASCSGRNRDARGRSGPGPQRHGRQFAGQPRQPRRNPHHERDLRPRAPRREDPRPDPSLFHRSGTRGRSRRPGIHPGRGRHGGGGPGEPQTPRGIGREPDPGPHGKRAASRAAGRAKPDDRQEPRHSPGGQRDRPGGFQQCHGPDSRRKRRGQGARRPGHPLFQPPPRQRLRLLELRGPFGGTLGQRIVRTRAGGLHRGHGAEDRQVRSGPSRHAHARRNRRDEPGLAGQVPPRAGGASLRARGRQQAASRSMFA